MAFIHVFPSPLWPRFLPTNVASQTSVSPWVSMCSTVLPVISRFTIMSVFLFPKTLWITNTFGTRITPYLFDLVSSASPATLLLCFNHRHSGESFPLYSSVDFPSRPRAPWGRLSDFHPTESPIGSPCLPCGSGVSSPLCPRCLCLRSDPP